MKILLSLAMAVCTCTALLAADFTNEELGISFTFPDGWKEDEVEDDDKPRTICTGVRGDSEYDVFFLNVVPSNAAEPNSIAMDDWAKDTRKAYKAKLKGIRIMKLESGNWYQLQMQYKKVMIYQYQTVQNGFTYNFTFINTNPDDLSYLKETEELIKSIEITKPTILEAIVTDFSEKTKHTKSGVMMPKHFYLTGKVDTDLPPNVFSTYLAALNDQTADYVLIAENFHQQLFGLNVSIKDDYIDEETADEVVKYTAAAFNSDDEIDFKKISAGMWDQSPENVYLYVFSITTATTDVVYYIFYVKNDSKTNTYKFQTTATLAPELEPLFYDMILESIVDL